MDPFDASRHPGEVTALPGLNGITTSITPHVERPFEREPTLRSRAISGALRLGLRPFIHYVPGRPTPIRTARSYVDAASRLIPPTPRVRIRPLNDPQVETGRRRTVRGEWVMDRDAGDRAADGAI